jgi:xanthine dehydrogenase accessory factor
MDAQVYNEIQKLLASGGRGALATVIGATGSTPGKEGAKMLVRADGSTVGTIGGGCTEASVWALAREVMDTDCPRRASFRLTPKQAGEEGLACGGVVDIFVEPIGHPLVILFGAGHIARSVAHLLKLVGMDTLVVDDRAQFANETHFPHSRILVSDFESAFDKLEITPSSYVVIVTRGHRYDQMVLQGAVRTEASFIGLIGSKVKIAHIFHALAREGIPKERLLGVRAPIGLDIGARSPEEIAVSIVAQIIAHRRRAHVKGNDPERLPEHPSPLASS